MICASIRLPCERIPFTLVRYLDSCGQSIAFLSRVAAECASTAESSERAGGAAEEVRGQLPTDKLRAHGEEGGTSCSRGKDTGVKSSVCGLGKGGKEAG